MILGLCDRFGCLPSQLEDEDAGVLRLMKIVALGGEEVTGDAEHGSD